MVDSIDSVGDFDSERVPAALCRILAVEIVLAVLAGTLAALDDVLLRVADDNREIAVLLDALLRDGLDGARTARTMDSDDTIDYRGGEFARIRECVLPLVHGGHAH